MSSSHNQASVKQLFQLLSDVIGYAIAILVYVFAIIGTPPPPFSDYPATFVTLTVLLSLIVLAIWRLPKIRNKKYHQIYTMPKSQRYIELATLVALLLLAVYTAVAKARSIAEEFSIACINEYNSVSRIVIADFTSESNSFSDKLATSMMVSAGERVQVCRYRHQIKKPDDALTAAQKYHAIIVIWGFDTKPRDIVLTQSQEQQLPVTEFHSIPEEHGDEMATFLAESIVAELQFQIDDIDNAKSYLTDSIRDAESQGMMHTNPCLLAEGYFMLGAFSDHNQLKDKQRADSASAISAYSKAIGLCRDLYSAYLNRSELYQEQGEYEQAIEDLSFLISANSGITTESLFLRAQAYLKLQRYPEAISDLKAALQDPLVDPSFGLYPDIVYALGKAYLLNAEYAMADQTFQRLPTLSSEEVQYYENSLEELRATAVTPDAQRIITRALNHIHQQVSP